MSEIPTKPSTTKESGNNTQSGTISIPDINFSINASIEPDVLQTHEVELADLPDDEPFELSVNIPEEFIAPTVGKQYGTIIYADQIEWNKVPEYPLLDWREENGTLILRYAGLSHDTDWSTIHRLRAFTKLRRRQEIEKTVGSKTHKKITAFSIFCRLVDEGVIKVPCTDTNLVDVCSQYSAEKDPEHGKVESILEG